MMNFKGGSCLSLRPYILPNELRYLTTIRLRPYALPKKLAFISPLFNKHRHFATTSQVMSSKKQDLIPAQQGDNKNNDSLHYRVKDESNSGENNISEEDDDPGFVKETWGLAVRSIKEATKNAFPESPKDNDISAFQTYWRGVFSQLATTVASDTSIPKFLTFPPSKVFEITVFHEDYGFAACPCCLPTVKPSFVIRNINGVTKVDLIEGIAQYMYGDTLPTLYLEEPVEEGQKPIEKEYDEDMDDIDEVYIKQATALVYHQEWLVWPADLVSPGMWMFCCAPDKYMEISQKEAA
ncbi:hypothetical protein BGZ63DRAFT_387938 [Mariannaea sp. PMI_226]|nr:hypothetical protein BGZ63DRAFT_387938 [Mariannaea sp. PMI_226]